MLGDSYLHATGPKGYVGSDGINSAGFNVGTVPSVQSVDTAAQAAAASSEKPSGIDPGVWSLISQGLNVGRDITVAAIQAKGGGSAQIGQYDYYRTLLAQGKSPEEARRLAFGGGFSFSLSNPWIIVGGVALIAGLFILGTRK